jgi:hypothetical protein
MKDKMEVKNKQSVFHKLDEGQNGGKSKQSILHKLDEGQNGGEK